MYRSSAVIPRPRKYIQSRGTSRPTLRKWERLARTPPLAALSITWRMTITFRKRSPMRNVYTVIALCRTSRSHRRSSRPSSSTRIKLLSVRISIFHTDLLARRRLHPWSMTSHSGRATRPKSVTTSLSLPSLSTRRTHSSMLRAVWRKRMTRKSSNRHTTRSPALLPPSKRTCET